VLSRWSRLKSESKKTSNEAPVLQDSIAPLESQNAPKVGLSDPPMERGEAQKDAATPSTLSASELKDLPNIADLGNDSDYTPFMQSGVDPATRNAAMRKLFSDPHYNVMDGLDIYIDDYSKPDPIPPEMLKRLMQSKMFNLFNESPESDNSVVKPELLDNEPRENPSLKDDADK
jgi:hypothetical protein